MTDASLDDVRAFACVARMGSFTKAAKTLDTSTSNLSHTIRRVENRLGVKLLYRNSRSVAPTEAGEALLRTVSPALEAIGEALKSLREERESVAGALRLTMTRQAYSVVVQPILPAFLAAYPDASVEVLIDYAYRDIIADRFDGGIRLGEKIERDMIALKVGPDLRMAVVATPAYLAGRAAISHPSELMEHRCVNYRMTGAGSLYAWEFERDDEELRVQVAGPLAFNEPELMLDAVLGSIGIGYLLDHEVAADVNSGRLVRLLDDWCPPFPGFHFYYSSRGRQRPVLAAFLDAMRQALLS